MITIVDRGPRLLLHQSVDAANVHGTGVWWQQVLLEGEREMIKQVSHLLLATHFEVNTSSLFERFLLFFKFTQPSIGAQVSK